MDPSLFDYGNLKSLDNRALLYKLKSDLNLNMIDLWNYIREKHLSSIDCEGVKKKYIYLRLDGADPEDVLIHFLMQESDIVEERSYNIFKDNLDIFFDITEKEEDSIIIELT